MVKVKARIMTDVEYMINVDIKEGAEVKRKLLEYLAKDGYENNQINFIKTEKVDVEDLDLDLDLDMSEFAKTFIRP